MTVLVEGLKTVRDECIRRLSNGVLYGVGKRDGVSEKCSEVTIEGTGNHTAKMLSD